MLDKFDGKSADGCMPANYLLLCIIIIRTIDSCDGVFGCLFFKRVNWEIIVGELIFQKQPSALSPSCFNVDDVV